MWLSSVCGVYMYLCDVCSMCGMHVFMYLCVCLWYVCVCVVCVWCVCVCVCVVCMCLCLCNVYVECVWNMWYVWMYGMYVGVLCGVCVCVCVLMQSHVCEEQRAASGVTPQVPSVLSLVSLFSFSLGQCLSLA